MAIQNNRPNQNRGNDQSDHTPGSSSDRSRSSRVPHSIADDRGITTDRDRRSFSGDREADELGSEMADESSIEDNDENVDWSGGRSNR